MSKVENLQTINRAKPFPCVSVALVVLAMFVLSWLAAQGVRNNLQPLLIFAGLCLPITTPTQVGCAGYVQSMRCYGFHLRLGCVRYCLLAGPGDDKRKTVLVMQDENSVSRWEHWRCRAKEPYVL